MVTAFLIRNPGSAFATNLSMLTVCLVLAFVVHHAAPAIYALRGWRKVGANVGMTAASLIVLLASAHPQLVRASQEFVVACYCFFLDWCCFFAAPIEQVRQLL